MPFSIQDEPVVQKLINDDEEFRKLVDEHKKLSNQAEQLINKHPLTPEDEIELVRIKKLKLKDKDEMYKMLASAKSGSA